MNDILTAWCEGFDDQDMDAVGALIADDFSFEAWYMEEPMTKAQWLGIMDALFNASSDINFDWSAVPGDPNALSFHITGTHTGTLDLTILGMTNLVSTGLPFDLPPSTYRFTLEDGKVARIVVDVTEGEGLKDIVAQLRQG